MINRDDEILITGASGFLGKHLVQKLKENGYSRLICTTRQMTPSDFSIFIDLTDESKVKTLFKLCEPKAIIHLAGNPNTKKTPQDPTCLRLWADNVDATRHLLNYCPKDCLFLFASSIVVYGDTPNECAVEYFNTNPYSMYAASKVAGEALVNQKAIEYNEFGFMGIFLRFCALVGTGATHGILPDVIRKLKILKDGEPLELFGKHPGTIKPYLHVSDAVNAILFLLNQEKANNYIKTYNVCQKDSISSFELAQTVMYVINKWPEIVFNESKIWPGDNKELWCSNDVLLNKGWSPVFSKSGDSIIAATKEILRGHDNG